MKKTVLIGTMAFCAFSMFAQKSNVNKALSATKGGGTWTVAEITENKALITPTLTNPETKDDAKTWYTAGMVANKEYDYEFMQTQTGQATDNAAKKGAIVLSLLDYFTKADALDVLPDEKGKVKLEYRKDIVPIVKFYRQPLWDFGAYSFEKGDMASAAKAFAALAEMPNMPMMKDDKDMVTDSAFFAGAMENYELATVRQASTVLTEQKDTVAYYQTIQAAYDKNPNSKTFLTTLIDYHARISQDNAKAVELLDKAIAQEPQTVLFPLIKAQVLARSGDIAAANAGYEKVLALEPNNTDAITGQAMIFIEAGDKFNDEANATMDINLSNAKAAERNAQYVQAIPFLEKIRKIDPTDVMNLKMLQQLYYNTEGESENFKAIKAEVDALK